MGVAPGVAKSLLCPVAAAPVPKTGFFGGVSAIDIHGEF